MKTLTLCFFYHKHSLLNLNNNNQDDIPLNTGIQIEWHQKMMTKFGHNNAIVIDATFGTLNPEPTKSS